MVTSEKPKDSKGTNVSSENSNVRESKNGIQNSSEIPADVSVGGDSSSNGYDVGGFGVALNKPPTFMGIDGLKSLRLTARVISFIQLPDQQMDAKISLSMEADTIDGYRYILNEKDLEYREIEYYFIDDCLLELRKGELRSLVTCNSAVESVASNQALSRSTNISLL